MGADWTHIGNMSRFEPPMEDDRRRRDFIGLQEIPEALAAVQGHAHAVVQRRRDHGLPTCGDDVSDVRKLSALMEEVGEVARAIQDGDANLRAELLDVATAAALWAWALKQESS